MEIIVKINGKYQILKIDLHEYIKFQSKNDNKFMIFPVKYSEYKFMKDQIEKGNFNTDNDEINRLMYMVEYNGEKNNIVVDNYNIEVEDFNDCFRGSYIVDADDFYPIDRNNEKFNNFKGIKVYTTSRYEEVIAKFFHEFIDIKFKKIAEKIFKTEEKLTEEELNFFEKCITNNNPSKIDKDKVKSKIISK